jgi:hypothetical protein
MHKKLISYIRRQIMRTTLDLPEYLINKAIKVLHINAKTKVIIVALEGLIKRSRIADSLLD